MLYKFHLVYCIFSGVRCYCVSFSMLLDGVWLSRNKRITYLFTNSLVVSWLTSSVSPACYWPARRTSRTSSKYHRHFCWFHLSCTIRTTILHSLLLLLLLLLQYHHPPDPGPVAQLPPAQASLSSPTVENILPLEIKVVQSGCEVIIALPASPLYPATVSWYLPTSSLMENVEYSAKYHKPSVRWIYIESHETESFA